MKKIDIEKTAIKIPTGNIIGETATVAKLNNLSTRIENVVGSNQTTWHFNEISKALEAVHLVQGLGVPFLWIETTAPALIIAYDMEP